MGVHPRDSRVKKMTEVERAYLGAWIDADGSAMLRGRDARKDNAKGRIAIAQKDVEIVSTALRLTQAGNINLNKKSLDWSGVGLAGCDMWVWSLDSQRDIEDLMEQCYPYSEKLQRLRAVWYN